jgi:hypothetical protein
MFKDTGTRDIPDTGLMKTGQQVVEPVPFYIRPPRQPASESFGYIIPVFASGRFSMLER